MHRNGDGECHSVLDMQSSHQPNVSNFQTMQCIVINWFALFFLLSNTNSNVFCHISMMICVQNCNCLLEFILPVFLETGTVKH